MSDSLFDYAEGQRLKNEGIKRAANNPVRPLDHAKAFAREAALQRGEVTADDVYKAFIARGMDYTSLGNAAGAIFRGREWVFTGKWLPSARPSNHAHMNRVWRLSEDQTVSASG